MARITMKNYVALAIAGALALGVFVACPNNSLFYPVIQVLQSSHIIKNGDTFSFNNADVGEQKTVVFTISNIGKSELILTNTPPVMLSDDSTFSVSLQPLTAVPEGGSVNFGITFAPLASGSRITSVTIKSNDPVTTTLLFSVSGDGVGGSEIDISAIPGVSAPAYGEMPVTTITETAQYTGTVSWSPADSTFGGETVYTATITLTAKSGYTLTGLAADFFTVAGATTVTNAAGSGVVTAVFPATDNVYPVGQWSTTSWTESIWGS